MWRGILLLALVACGAHDVSSGRARHTLVIAYGADEFGLALNRPRLGRYPLNAGIYEPLVRLGRNFDVEPALASRWEQLDSNTYRFHLLPRVVFSDGSPFDARAVAATLARRGVKAVYE